MVKCLADCIFFSPIDLATNAPMAIINPILIAIVKKRMIPANPMADAIWISPNKLKKYKSTKSTIKIESKPIADITDMDIICL